MQLNTSLLIQLFITNVEKLVRRRNSSTLLADNRQLLSSFLIYFQMGMDTLYKNSVWLKSKGLLMNDYLNHTAITQILPELSKLKDENLLPYFQILCRNEYKLNQIQCTILTDCQIFTFPIAITLVI